MAARLKTSKGTKHSTQQKKEGGKPSHKSRASQVSLDPVKNTHEKWRLKTFGTEDHHIDTSLQPAFPPGRPASCPNGQPILPDLRGFRLSLRTLACLLPYLVTLTSNRTKAMWGDPKMKPVWWPKDIPFKNPAAGGWEKGPVKRNRAGQNEGLFDLLETCYVYYNQGERFLTDSVDAEGWKLLVAGDEI